MGNRLCGKHSASEESFERPPIEPSTLHGIMGQSSSHDATSKESPLPSSHPLDGVFTRYTEQDGEGVMTGPGFQQFFEEVGVDLADLLSLYVAFRFKAFAAGTFTRDEFVKGMQSVGCSSVEELKAFIPELRKKMEIPREFSKFHNYVFDISRDSVEQRSIRIGVAVPLLELLLVGRYSLGRPFVEFLGHHRPADGRGGVMTRDEWNSVLPFMQRYPSVESLADYSIDEAWPVLLDDFVESLRGGEGAATEMTPPKQHVAACFCSLISLFVHKGRWAQAPIIQQAYSASCPSHRAPSSSCVPSFW
eukprot:TRINITY_DN10142_c0_g1_i1.p1 TRINITY_DN10142_c0_g1~~TRINITY_DN10142_c0_g1_i1.p1  ORF type:complete len:315 (-),score=45.71 TRINITY_DN10142_c0_g1_i1:405-1319(-)